MASISITTSLHITCRSNLVSKKQQSQSSGASRSLGPTWVTTEVVTLDVEGQKVNNTKEHHGKSDKSKNAKDEVKSGLDTETSAPKFMDKRWKNGKWDLNMFVKDGGKMDWDALIVAEARRRKFLELYPEAATNQDPVLFRSSTIPWWAWLVRSYLPEAELLNGRAAMVGFFMAYLVDALTRLDVVGQTGNFVCKAGLFVTVIGVTLLRRTEDFETLKSLADEATIYDDQWKSSWQQDRNATTAALKQIRKKI